MEIPRIEKTKSGIAVISAFGTRVEFDENYEMISKVKERMIDSYFFKMGEEERAEVAEWLSTTEPATENQSKFLQIVKAALRYINYDYRISTIEPSIDEDGKLFFEKGQEIVIKNSISAWENLGKSFAPELGSRLADKYELHLWYAYRIAKGYWTIQYVCDDSSAAGNYSNSPDSTHELEASGAREVGGFCDGTGNIRKVVSSDAGFVICGGCFLQDGWSIPVANRKYHHDLNDFISRSTGVFVLLK